MKEEYNELIREIEKFLEKEQVQQTQAMDIEKTLEKLGFRGHPHKCLEQFKDDLQAWERVLERMGILREERSQGVLIALLAIAYERNKEKQ